MRDRIQVKVAEIQSIIQLAEYNHIIAEVVHKIYASGCAVMTWPEQVSKHSSGLGGCTVCLGIHPVRDKKQILWDLFHEFGHHLDPNKLKKEDEHNPLEQQRRERVAWQLADEAFAGYPALQHERQSYMAYRNFCLKSYSIADEEVNHLNQ